MSSLWPIISSVLGVFLVIAIGAVCRRLQWLTTGADRTLAQLTANVMLPAYFIHKILGSQEFESLATTWPLPVFGFVSTAIGFGIGMLFARVLGPRLGLDSDAKQRAFAICVGICNYGYIPLPLAEKFYPEAMIELILHNVGVDIALWSVGIIVISGAAGGQWKRAFWSAPLIAVVVASTLRALELGVYLPEPVLAAIGALGACAIPLGLLLSGAIMVDFVSRGTFANSPIRHSWKVIAASIGLRQLIMPVMMLAAAMCFTGSQDTQRVIVLQAAMPAAVFPIILVRLYEKDTKTAIAVILSTSLAGIVLIPIWLAVGNWWLGP